MRRREVEVYLLEITKKMVLSILSDAIVLLYQ